ncbi:myosin f, partial [Cystoisospora suis]
PVSGIYREECSHDFLFSTFKERNNIFLSSSYLYAASNEEFASQVKQLKDSIVQSASHTPSSSGGSPVPPSSPSDKDQQTHVPQYRRKRSAAIQADGTSTATSPAEKLAVQTEEELRSLRVELEKREKESSSQYQEQQKMIEKLKEALKVAETSLSQEQKQRAEAEARYRLVLEDSSSTSSALRGTSAGTGVVGMSSSSSLVEGDSSRQAAPAGSPAAGSDDTSRFMTPSPIPEEQEERKEETQRLPSSGLDRSKGSREGGGDLSTLVGGDTTGLPLVQPSSSLASGLPPLSSSYLSSADWEVLWHDQRWIDLLLLGPGDVGKTGLVEQLLVKIGDEVHLEQLRVTRKMEDQAPFSKLPQHYDLIYPFSSSSPNENRLTGGDSHLENHLSGFGGALGSVAYHSNPTTTTSIVGGGGSGRDGGSRSSGGEGIGRRLTLIDFPGLSRTKQDPTPRIKQAFIVGLVYDPTRPETCEEALRIAKNLVLPARGGDQEGGAGGAHPHDGDKKEESKQSQFLSAALRGRVYIIENTWRVASKEGTIRVDTAAVRDTAAGLRCHYRELIHLDTLVEEILPLMNEWRKTLQQHRLSLIQQHTRILSQASPTAVPMLASASQQPVDAHHGGYPVHPSMAVGGGGEGKGAGMHAPSTHLGQYPQRGSGTLSSSFSSASVGGAPPGGGSGRYNGLSSNFFDSIRSFLSQSSMRSGSSASLMSGTGVGGFAGISGAGGSSSAAAASILGGGFAGNFLGGKGHHHHRHPSVEIRLLRPSMKAGEAALAAYRKKGGDKAEGVDGHTLVPVQELQAAITCITFVPSTGPGEYPRLLINCCDCSVAIVECIYGPPPGVLTNLVIRYGAEIDRYIDRHSAFL